MQRIQISWRAYQQRILDNLEKYLQNDVIHLVAPPGSGKTLLGLEILQRLQKKTLILVPSLMLKKQWLETITTYDPKLITSDELQSKSQIILTTYQEVYYKLKKNPDYLKGAGIKFMIMDEAHHLKSNWSEVLLELKRQSQNLQTLSLTATPPFDTNQKEWQRYLELNGPIDEEIAVSELLKEDVLAPYHDYLYLIPATQEAQRHFNLFLDKQNRIVAHLLNNEEVTDCLLAKPFIQFPLHQTDFIYKNFDLYLSCLFYLHEQGYPFTEEHWQILGVKKQKKRRQIPSQSKSSLTTLYSYLFKENSELTVFAYLKNQKWLYDEKLTLFPNYSENLSLVMAPQMKEAIAHIVLKEESYLGSELCGVILLDRIKVEGLKGKETLLDYGVVPVFLQLLELVQPQTELAAICGDFLLISKEIAKSYQDYQLHFDETLATQGYHHLKITDGIRGEVLKITTQLLNQKRINLLVSTISLLGEGWNCPAVNTLILGNKAGSYVQTQQLRGRGLRKAAPHKMTNIWHIGLVFPEIELDQQVELKPILKRLTFIEGLNLLQETPAISTGEERFDLPQFLTLQNISSYTQQNLSLAKNRQHFFHLWQQALATGSHLSMPIFIRREAPVSSVRNEDPAQFKEQNQRAVSFLNAILTGRIKNYLAARTQQRRWQQDCQQKEKLAMALFHYFQSKSCLSAQDQLAVVSDWQTFSCEVKTIGYLSERRFMDAVAQLFSPISSPRYLLKINKYYYAIPEETGRNKNEVLLFLKEIKKYYIKAEAVYTKNILGRQALLEARFQKANWKSDQVLINQRIWH